MRFSLRDMLWLTTVATLLLVIWVQHGAVRDAHNQAMAIDRERVKALTARDYYKREYGQMFKSYLQAKLD